MDEALTAHLARGRVRPDERDRDLARRRDQPAAIRRPARAWGMFAARAPRTRQRGTSVALVWTCIGRGDPYDIGRRAALPPRSSSMRSSAAIALPTDSSAGPQRTDLGGRVGVEVDCEVALPRRVRRERDPVEKVELEHAAPLREREDVRRAHGAEASVRVRTSGGGAPRATWPGCSSSSDSETGNPS